MSGCRDLSPEEYARVEAVLQTTGTFACRNATLFRLGCRIGGRISELLQLRVGDVMDVAGWVMSPVVELRRQTTKGKRAGRNPALSFDAQEMLGSYVVWLSGWYRRPLHASDWLFPSNKTGVRLDRRSWWRILDGAYQAAGVVGSTGTHCMRKTALTTLIRAGADPAEVLAVSGHSDLKTLSLYLGVNRARLQANAEAAEHVLAGTGTQVVQLPAVG
jgi:site-specific recombinase XerD